MKRLSIIFTFISIVLSANASETVNYLTSVQEHVILETIDYSCEEDWCDGSYDYSFDKITCNFDSGTCKFNFQYIDWDFTGKTDNDKDESGRWNSICNIGGITSYDDMLIDGDNGHHELNWAFQEKINQCLIDNDPFM